MAHQYTVLADHRELRHEIEIKKSRFLTVLQRVDSEQDATDLVADLRREFHDARHHCSAWVLGPERWIQRSSDDGEPSGTAGVPMLEAITQRQTGPDGEPDMADLSDLCAVVVRWFGGTLLGAGGLVRAYSDSVSQALDRAALVQRARMAVFELPAPLSLAPRWENHLRAAAFTVQESRWAADSAVLSVAVQDSEAALDHLGLHVARLTAGRAAPTRVGTQWVDLPSA